MPHLSFSGSSSGLGLETARVLAKRGSHVIMAVRNTAAGNKGKDSIVNEIPSSQVLFLFHPLFVLGFLAYVVLPN